MHNVHNVMFKIVIVMVVVVVLVSNKISRIIRFSVACAVASYSTSYGSFGKTDRCRRVPRALVLKVIVGNS